MTSLKEPEKRIDMQAEFLDLAAIDTGKYRGMVIQDPADKRNIQGFVYLGLAWGSILQPLAPALDFPVGAGHQPVHSH